MCVSNIWNMTVYATIRNRESLTTELTEVLNTSPLPPSSPSSPRRSTNSVRHPHSPATLPVKSPTPPPPPPPPPSCIYCSTPQSKDPTHKYCTQCGAELSSLQSLQYDAAPSGRMPVCPGCRATLPPGTSRCIVCDSDVPPPKPIPTIKAQATTDVSSITVCSHYTKLMLFAFSFDRMSAVDLHNGTIPDAGWCALYGMWDCQPLSSH